ncbi:MAG: TerC family protein [Pseudomonadota bacterium]|nr:TerC family protein [Pseudomonadota bacterium]
MEWMSDPTAWLGLATLVALEIVLGIDNLVFIAILAGKLPPHQRDRARKIGLSLALLMRLALLASIAWMVTLIQPLFTVLGIEISGRDLILIVGGLFLILKGTMELHERLEGAHGMQKSGAAHAVFWQVIAQIVVLDAVFSLDSVITAVGMVDDLMIMAIAVVVAMGVMMVASGPLMTFVSRHPTVVILCLGFLLMIGFTLTLDGFGIHIPKGYLYAAIGFSILIEAFNQTARRNRDRIFSTMDLRDRTAQAVLRLMGGKKNGQEAGAARGGSVSGKDAEEVFTPAERDMIQGVMTLGERSARSVMTPRPEIVWLDADAPEGDLRRTLLESGRSRFPIVRGGNIDEVIGVAFAKDILRDLLEHGRLDLTRSMHAPLFVPYGQNVLTMMEHLRGWPVQTALVVDEFGSTQGIVTPADIFEAITGAFPDEGDEAIRFERESEGAWLVDGQIDILRLASELDADLTDDKQQYSTLAGYLLTQFGHLPSQGEKIIVGALAFEVVEMRARRIHLVRILRVMPAPVGGEESNSEPAAR